MTQWLRQPCEKAASAVGYCCISPCRMLAPALHLPVASFRRHKNPGYTGKLSASTARGYQLKAQAGRDTLLRGVPKEYTDDVARVVEIAERAAGTTWTTIHTGESHYTLSCSSVIKVCSLQVRTWCGPSGVSLSARWGRTDEDLARKLSLHAALRRAHSNHPHMQTFTCRLSSRTPRSRSGSWPA